MNEALGWYNHVAQHRQGHACATAAVRSALETQPPRGSQLINSVSFNRNASETTTILERITFANSPA